MDTILGNDPMPNPPKSPLGGLDPANLLKQGAAEDTFMDAAATSFNPPPIEELVAVFPQFEIVELIGKGGMGAVYKVRQKDLDRIVALKILLGAIGQSPEFSNRFTREARALAKLNHPGIVTLHEFGQQGGLYFILMEFVDGVNLAQLMKTGRISPREALAIVPQICDALQFAHDQGIVHRDIKPANILLDRLGRVKVADFGIAKIVGDVTQAFLPDLHSPPASLCTEAGKILGTPHYMAPEQIDHPSDVNHRADIYALGVVFYQMLTGELPGKHFEAPSKKVHIDVRLDEIVLKAMETDPELRFQQASVMKTRMDDLAAQQQPELKKRSLAKTIAIVCCTLALILVGFGILYLNFTLQKQNTAHRKSRAKVISESSSELERVYPAKNATVESTPSSVAIWSHPNTLKWLNMMDVGAYSESWDYAGSSIQRQKTKDEWIAKLESSRRPLGHLISRSEVATIKGIKPDETEVDDFYASYFNSVFSEQKIRETVLFRSGQDGPWKVTAYYIRPQQEGAAASTQFPVVDGVSAPHPEKEVAAFAERWLTGIDAGNYAQSWQDAAKFFQSAITESAWVAALEGVRKPLGAVKSRKIRAVNKASSLPGAPDGEYLIIQFDTAFAAKAEAVETVTFKLEEDGVWKAAGYFVR